MAEKPILFNGDMVRALLAGNKTQTRRPVKYIPALGEPDLWCDMYAVDPAAFIELTGDIAQFSPFGKPGDVLWVREPAKVIAHEWKEINGIYDRAIKAEYSDGTISDWIHRPSRLAPVAIGKGMPNGCFKEAGRIKLKVKRVWVERLLDCRPMDAGKEGIWTSAGLYRNGSTKGYGQARHAFFDLWDSIYGTAGDDPWVWCCEFEVDYNG